MKKNFNMVNVLSKFGDRTPFKSGDLNIVKATSLRANDFTPTLLGGIPPGLLSKRSICCPNLVTTVPLKVNYVMMVF